MVFIFGVCLNKFLFFRQGKPKLLSQNTQWKKPNFLMIFLRND
jgi:hypothetical protein